MHRTHLKLEEYATDTDSIIKLRLKLSRSTFKKSTFLMTQRAES